MEHAQYITHTGSFAWDLVSGEWQCSAEYFRLWGLLPYSSPPSYELFRRCIHPNDMALVEEALQCALQGGRFYDCEHRVVWHDGSVHHIHGLAEVALGDAGQPVKMFGTVHDVSERNASESELHLMKYIMDNSRNAIYRLNQQGRVIYANESALHNLGYSAEELYSKFIWDFDSHFSAERWQESWVQQKQIGINNIETLHRRKDGTFFPVEIDASYIEHKGDECSVTFVRDITERKQAEIKTTALFQRNQLLMASTHEGVHVLDDQCRIIEANDAFCRHLGYTQSEVMQLSLFDIEAKLTADEIHENFEKLLNGHAVFESIHRRKDSTLVEVELSVSGVQLDGQRYIMALSHDITVRKLAENALKALNENLAQRVDAELAELREKDLILIEQARLASMGEMINSIAHQWRQPLSVVGLTFQNMEIDFKEGMLDEQSMHEYVRKALAVVKTMSTTIDDFRDFFRTNREKREFNLHESVTQAVDLIELSLVNHGIALRCAEEEQIFVLGYPNEFSQVLLNLLSNAKDVLVEHKIHPASIEIFTHSGNGDAIIRVRDNGGGIPDEIVAKLFDPYFTTKVSGTGIGLYMSKMIIKKMGGTIDVRNVGEGCEFTLTLPVVTI